ncbi:MAG TPA: rhomboid family intramembrane serine protease [Acidimicrobiales bacterium]|nr:rhomboid family intramembrane serine protease [Acidimicrobiales bacterium]
MAQPGMPGHGPASGGEQIGIGLDARCYQHPERLAGSVCRSCNRPICADCMVQAPVGWQCRPCVRRNAKTSPVIRYRPGASNATGLRSIPVTLGLIVACTIVWLVELAQPPLEINWSVVGIAIQQGGEWYRLFTAMFIHYSWPHIALNMLSLYFVGRALEPVLGWWRYLALYLVAGFGGDLAAYLFTSPLVPVGGASGAIFGIFGAYFVFARRARVDTSRIVTILVINLVYSFSISGISWQGHVGGLITGVAIAAGYGRVKDRRYRVVADLGAAASAFVVLAVISVLPLGLPRVG